MAAKHEFELNIKGEREEIVQGMALVFLDKYLEELDSPDNVYTLLYSVARHVALTVKGSLLSHDTRYVSLTAPDNGNHRSLRPVEMEVPLAEAAEVVEIAAEDFTHNVEQAIDRRRAEEKLLDRLRRLDPALQARLEQAAMPVERKPRASRKLSDEARELLTIRDRMRLDNRKFALALGIEHPLLCAYIYGRTKKVRDKVMQQARSMYRNRGSAREEMLGRLANRPMQRIVDGWLERLRVTPEQAGFTVLGQLLGVSWHTARRWHSNEFKPSLEKLQKLDQLVQKAARASHHRSIDRPPTHPPESPQPTIPNATNESRRTDARPAIQPRGMVVVTQQVGARWTPVARLGMFGSSRRRRRAARNKAAKPVSAKVPAAQKKAAPSAVKKAPSKAKALAVKRPLARKVVATKPATKKTIATKAAVKVKPAPAKPPVQKASSQVRANAVKRST